MQTEWQRVMLASIGDAVVSTDAHGRVTFMNSVAEALCGWPAPEAIGRDLPEVFNIIDEQTRRTAENPALRALQEGAIVGLANHTVLIARDGTERPIDDSVAPIRDGDGTTFGAVLVFRDISERRRSALRRRGWRPSSSHPKTPSSARHSKASSQAGTVGRSACSTTRRMRRWAGRSLSSSRQSGRTKSA